VEASGKQNRQTKVMKVRGTTREVEGERIGRGKRGDKK
jgi:hypothetical protein